METWRRGRKCIKRRQDDDKHDAENDGQFDESYTEEKHGEAGECDDIPEQRDPRR